MAQAIPLHFPLVCRIEEITGKAVDAEGGLTDTWGTVPGLTEIACMTGLVTGRQDTEVRTEEMTRVRRQRYALLQGAYPEIRPEMRLVDANDGEIWNILDAAVHPMGIVTRLFIEQVGLGSDVP